jgi:hypothetical protein
MRNPNPLRQTEKGAVPQEPVLIQFSSFLSKTPLSLNQGNTMVLRERAAVVWGIIGNLFMAFFAKA